jgi:hypothetical protein
MRADLTGLAYTYVQPSYKKEEKLNPSDLLLWIELTEMLQGLRRGAPAVARWLPLGQHISVTLKGSSQLGKCLRNPSWFSTRHRARSRPWVPYYARTVSSAWAPGCNVHFGSLLALCVRRWSPHPHAVAAPARTYQKTGPVGSLEGFPGEGRLRPCRPGSTGSPWWSV